MMGLANFVLGMGMIAWRGVVVMLLWNWFATEIGAPVIGVAVGIGLSLLATQLRPNVDWNDIDTEDEEWVARHVLVFVLSLFVLLFGWVTHAFVA